MPIFARFTITILLILQTASSFQSPQFLCEGTDASFSPDGKTIAFVNWHNIWLCDLKGAHRVQITHLQNCCYPCWSANGRTILFQSYGSHVVGYYEIPHFSIWIVNVDGSQAHQISEQTDVDDQYPHWSYDNSKIIWTHDKQLWICDTTGKHSHPFTVAPAKIYEYDGVFSPDGRTVAYVREDDYSVSGLWLIDSNGHNQRFTGILMRGQCIRWSHDGLFLYYLSRPGINKVNSNDLSEVQYISDVGGYRERNYFDVSPDDELVIFDTSGPEVDNPKLILTKLYSHN